MSSYDTLAEDGVTGIGLSGYAGSQVTLALLPYILDAGIVDTPTTDIRGTVAQQQILELSLLCTSFDQGYL